MDELEPKDVLETGLKTLFGPVNDLFLKLTGPAAEEYGLMWAESVRLRRTKRFVNGLAKTKRMVEGAGFDPRTIPEKLLLPIFEGMSTEDNEDLQTMWASLLANAASRENAEIVRPGFAAILRQMAPDEAALLKAIAQLTDEYRARLKSAKAPSKVLLDRQIGAQNALLLHRLTEGFASQDGETEAATQSRFQTCIQLLETSGLLDIRKDIPTLSTLGETFLEACRPPKPKA